MRQSIINCLAKSITRVPFGEKLVIIANVLVHDWRIHPSGGCFFNLPEERNKKIELVFHDLDSESKRILKHFLWKEYCNSSIPEEMGNCFYRHGNPKIFTKAEREEQKKAPLLLSKIKKKYKLIQNECAPESLVYHHGLDKMQQKVLNYIQGKDFIDAGACYGDSTLVFSQYHPRKIYAFEPSPINQQHFLELMKKTHVPEEIYELVPCGLDSKAGTLFFSDKGDGSNDLKKSGETKADLITLDSYVFKNQLNVGLIKADVEGMGLEMLKGAHETILKYRPVLSLSIYHNQEEFFGIYPLLKEWKLNYHFHVRSLSFPFNIGEITLIGVPEELLK